MGKSPWRRKWQPKPVFLPGEFHGERNLVGYSTCRHKELDTTKRLITQHNTILSDTVVKKLFSTCCRYVYVPIEVKSEWCRNSVEVTTRPVGVENVCFYIFKIFQRSKLSCQSKHLFVLIPWTSFIFIFGPRLLKEHIKHQLYYLGDKRCMSGVILTSIILCMNVPCQDSAWVISFDAYKKDSEVGDVILILWSLEICLRSHKW